MASALQAAGVPEQVVIVPGSQHGEAYLPEVDGTILKYLGERLGLPGLKPPANNTPAGSSSTVKVLVICSVVVVAAKPRGHRLRPLRGQRPTGSPVQL